MTPEERHADAIAAAHEWRDEERRKHDRDHRIPAKGDKIKVEWPNGPRNFDMEFLRLDGGVKPHADGWYFLMGIIGYSEPIPRFGLGPVADVRTVYARYISPGHYEMIPKKS